MSEWPVEIIEFSEMGTLKREPIPANTTLRVARGGGSLVKGYHFQCPCCGTPYWVPVEGSGEKHPVWTADEEGGLTLRPSLLCNTPGGSGHYWLTDGVLREV